MHSLSWFLSIDKLLENASQLGMGDNPTTTLHTETIKSEKTFLTKKILQKMKK